MQYVALIRANTFDVEHMHLLPSNYIKPLSNESESLHESFPKLRALLKRGHTIYIYKYSLLVEVNR